VKENSESSGTFYFVETKISKLIIIWFMHVSKLPRSYGNNIFPLCFFVFFSSLVSFQPHGFGAKRRISALKGRKINQAPSMDYIPPSRISFSWWCWKFGEYFPPKNSWMYTRKNKILQKFPNFLSKLQHIFSSQVLLKTFQTFTTRMHYTGTTTTTSQRFF